MVAAAVSRPPRSHPCRPSPSWPATNPWSSSSGATSALGKRVHRPVCRARELGHEQRLQRPVHHKTGVALDPGVVAVVLDVLAVVGQGREAGQQRRAELPRPLVPTGRTETAGGGAPQGAPGASVGARGSFRAKGRRPVTPRHPLMPLVAACRGGCRPGVRRSAVSAFSGLRGLFHPLWPKDIHATEAEAGWDPCRRPPF